MAGDEIKENSMQIFVATLLNLYGLKSKMLKRKPDGFMQS